MRPEDPRPSPEPGPESSASPGGRVQLDAALLKRLRRQHGYSQAYLAAQAIKRRIPLSIATIKRAELGLPVIYRTALQLAQLFELDVNRLLARASEPLAAGDRWPLVGREPELQLMACVIGAVQQEGSGRLLYIRALMGMGKSRLLGRAGLLAAQAGCSVCRCSADDSTGSGGLWAALVQVLCGGQVLLDTAPEPAPHTLPEALRDGPPQAPHEMPLELPLHAPPIASGRSPGNVPGSSPLSASRNSSYKVAPITRPDEPLAAVPPQALLAALEQRAGRHGLVVLIDALDEADTPSLDRLAKLMHQSRSLPVLWALASRAEHDRLESNLRFHLPDYPLTVLDLAPLSPAQAQRLARQVCPGDVPRQRISLEQAEGHPGFLVDLLQSQDGRTLSPALRARLQRQLGRLEAMDRWALDLAAVVQEGLNGAILQALCGDRAYTPDALLHQHWLRPDSGSGLRFVHEQVRRMIYGLMPAALRRELHLAAAAYYANLPAAGAGANASGDLHRADSAVDGVAESEAHYKAASEGLAHAHAARLQAVHLCAARSPQALPVLMQAVQACCADHRYAQALELLRLYEAIDFAALDFYALHAQFGRVLAALGHSEAARKHFERALARAKSLSDQVSVLESGIGLLVLMEETEEAQAWLQRLMQRVQPPGRRAAGPAQAVRLQLEGELLHARGDALRASELYRAALDAAKRQGDLRLEALALGALGAAFHAQGRMHDAADMLAASLKLSQVHGLLALEACSLAELAAVRLYLGQAPQALADAVRAAELAAQVGEQRGALMAHLPAGWSCASLGQSQIATAHFQAALERATAAQARRFVPLALEGLARVQASSGDAAQARLTLDRAWSWVETHKLHRAVGAWVLATYVMLESSDPLRRQAVDTGWQILHGGCPAPDAYRFLLALGQAAVASRNPSQATWLADQLEQRSAGSPCAWTQYHLSLLRAQARQLLQPFDPAPPDEIEALLEQGRLSGLGYAHTIRPDGA